MEEERIDSFNFSLLDLVQFASRPTEFRDTYNFNLTKGQLEQIYRNWLGRKICDAFPNEATRQTFDIKISYKEKVDVEKQVEIIRAMEKKLMDLQVLRKVQEALSLANLYGGSAIIIVADDNTSYYEPINSKKLKSIQSIEVLDCHQIRPFVQGYLPDPYHPEKYQLIPSDINRRITSKMQQDIGREWLIDADRVIRFDGVRLPPDLMRTNNYWGDSIFISVYEEILDYLRVYRKASDFISNPNPFVHQVDGLREIIATKGKDKVKEYLKSIYEARGMLGGYVIDKNDTFTFTNRTFAELANLLDRYGNKLVAATNIPYSILFGKGAEGLAAAGTGETERHIFYQNVMQYQEIVIRPALEKLVTLLFLAKDSPTQGYLPDDWHIAFKPLEKPSLKEELASKQIQATIDSTYMQMQVITPQEVRSSRFGNAEFSYDTILEDKELNADAQANQVAPPPEVIAQIQQQLQQIDDETLMSLTNNTQLQPFEQELLQAEILRRQQLREQDEKKDSLLYSEVDNDYMDDLQEQSEKVLDKPYNLLINKIKQRLSELPKDLTQNEILSAIDDLYKELPTDAIADSLTRQMVITALSQALMQNEG